VTTSKDQQYQANPDAAPAFQFSGNPGLSFGFEGRGFTGCQGKNIFKESGELSQTSSTHTPLSSPPIIIDPPPDTIPTRSDRKKNLEKVGILLPAAATYLKPPLSHR
jgi:hypothetical protein